MRMIDLRSDTVTKPTPEMLDFMLSAKVGDDVYGEDPTVNMLERKISEMTGKEAAIFAPTGTQTNLIALMSHCDRGDEYIVGQQGHTYKYEGGGAAVFGSIQPQPIDYKPDGTLDLDEVSKVIKPNDNHFARSKLMCLENTHAGKVLPLKYLREAKEFCSQNNLLLHLDGARVFNASVALNVPVSLIAENFDSLSICLSKGLGSPVGSVLCGSKTMIAKARRWRKVLGGGMRQSGYIAACGLYALQNNIDRLCDDHLNADLLAKGLSAVSGVEIRENKSQTNMVFLKMDAHQLSTVTKYMEKKGIKVGGYGDMRLVTHLGVSERDIKRVISTFQEFFHQKV